MFRYSFLVLAGACSIGVLAIFVKFAYQMGFTLGEVIGSQYLTGWLLLLVLTLLFFRQRVPLKKAIVLFFAGTSASFTGICYYAACKRSPLLSASFSYFNLSGSVSLLSQSPPRHYHQKKKSSLYYSY